MVPKALRVDLANSLRHVVVEVISLVIWTCKYICMVKWLKGLFGSREIHIHVHVDGCIKVDNNEQASATPKIYKSEPKSIEPNRDFELNDVKIPTVDFGEEVQP